MFPFSKKPKNLPTNSKLKFSATKTIEMLQIIENSKEIKSNFEKQGKIWIMELNPKNDAEYLIYRRGNAHVSIFQKTKTPKIIDFDPLEMVRSKIQINLKNPKQKLYLKFIGSLQHQENLDLEIIVNHEAEETKSKTEIKLAAKDNSKINFIGTIQISKKAENSEADLNIKSLILSKNCKISAKPNLQIENKKTSCSHGATISGIDKKEIQYLMQRGLQKEKAEKLILEGFLR